MALADESNFAYVKQVALDWREMVREKHQSLLMSPTQSLWGDESQLRMAGTRSRTQSMIPDERRASSFYRHRFSQQEKPLVIERREGSMEPSRIRINDELQIYIFQPIYVSPALRASIQPLSRSDLSLASTLLDTPLEEVNPVTAASPTPQSVSP
ncbi:uncharacterized protein LOC108104667 [Drosophila eugracilis]|uniref:uncharacterized protein LOC108104667 n=1 Tax=Drosophila eugracilis TaxID=29029 RepID=UPI0007E89608|nr:uncharacterized protein LOC108104667 [Drosophila eugracilis]